GLSAVPQARGAASLPHESRSSRREEAQTENEEHKRQKTGVERDRIVPTASVPPSTVQGPSATARALPPKAQPRPTPPAAPNLSLGLAGENALGGEASLGSGVQPAVALSPEAKAAAFAELRERALACVKCAHLASSRKNVVFGVGSIDAKLMFV